MAQLCNWCGFFGEPIEVHGSVLCQRCRANINPCCEGASVANKKSDECDPEKKEENE